MAIKMALTTHNLLINAIIPHTTPTMLHLWMGMPLDAIINKINPNTSINTSTLINIAATLMETLA